jgi:hypothetical protein
MKKHLTRRLMPFLLLTLTFPFAVPQSQAVATTSPSISQACNYDVVMVGARGSGQPISSYNGFGPQVHSVLSKLKYDLSSYFGLSTYYYPLLQYNAVSVGEGYFATVLDYASSSMDASVQSGILEATNVINALTECDKPPIIILTGYSQGSEVIHRTLWQLPSTVTNQIAGSMLLANPVSYVSDASIWPGTHPSTFNMSWCLDDTNLCYRQEGVRKWLSGSSYSLYSKNAERRNIFNICIIEDPVCDIHSNNDFFIGTNGVLDSSIHTDQYQTSTYSNIAASALLNAVSDEIARRLSVDHLYPWDFANFIDLDAQTSIDNKQELSNNNGFEDGWKYWTKTSGGSSDKTWRTGTHYDGSYGMHVDGDGSWSRAEQSITMTAQKGDSFVAEAMVRSVSGPHTGRIQIVGNGNGNNEASTTTFTATDDAWQLVRVPITLSQDRTSVKINLIAPAGNELVFDAVSLTRSVLSNGTFEDGWRNWGEKSGGNNDRTWRTGGRYDNSYGMHVDGNGVWSRAEQVMDVSSRAGDSYVAEAMVRAEAGVQTGRLQIVGLGGSGNESQTTTFSVGTDWTYVRVPITMTGSHPQLKLNLIAPAGNALLFDAVSITESITQNAGFEDGWQHWSKTNGGQSDRTWRTGTHYDGQYGMQVDGDGDWSRVEQELTRLVKSGDTFVAEAMVRSLSGEQTGRIQIVGNGNGPNESATTTFKATTEWQLVRVPITMSQDRTSVKINLIAPAGNTLVFDAVSLR